VSQSVIEISYLSVSYRISNCETGSSLVDRRDTSWRRRQLYTQ